jgi:hypothetical protein
MVLFGNPLPKLSSFKKERLPEDEKKDKEEDAITLAQKLNKAMKSGSFEHGNYSVYSFAGNSICKSTEELSGLLSR